MVSLNETNSWKELLLTVEFGDKNWYLFSNIIPNLAEYLLSLGSTVYFFIVNSFGARSFEKSGCNSCFAFYFYKVTKK